LDEEWRLIQDFPTYIVSSLGRVVNDSTHREIKQSTTMHGAPKVGLVLGGKQFTRVVSVLVCEAFVEGRTNIFDTPIHLDGDQTNNCAYNLRWRPRWFAWKYSRQFSSMEDIHTVGPVIEVESEKVYDTVLHAAMYNGLLLDDVWRSIRFKKYIFPTDQKFDIIR